MIHVKYLEKKDIPVFHVNGRNFKLADDVTVTLSNGNVITISKGFVTDFMSVPSWLWSFISPIDNGLLGDIIHDSLWGVKEKSRQLLIHGSIQVAKDFSDAERMRWRKHLSPETRVKNKLTNWFLENFSMKYYTGRVQMKHWKK